jgi:ankyrin repeat protein
LNAHTAASAGDLEALIIIASRNPEDVKRKDLNGWTPLHEAARGGHVEVVTWLLQRGLDMVSALFYFLSNVPSAFSYYIHWVSFSMK